MAECMACEQARQEIAGLQSDIAVFSPPALAPDFDARLMARFESHLAAGMETAAQKPRVSRTGRDFPFTMRLTLAGTALTALMLWIAYSGVNRMQNADNTIKNINVGASQQPREIDLPLPVTAFNKRHKARRSIKPAHLSPLLATRSALHTFLPYSGSRGKEKKRYAHLANHLHRSHQGSPGISTEPLSVAVSKHTRTPNIAAKNVSPDAALVTQTALSWREAGKVYAACSDFSRMRTWR